MPVTGAPSSTPGREVVDQVTILLVDDDETWARATARLLASNNDAFEVTTTHSLAAGRRAFADRDPDCVVCDYQLGDGTGLALLDTVREADPDRPFVLVTGRGDESVASEAIGRGVTDYIRKDRDDDEADLLASRITNSVRSYRTRRALERERRSKTAVLDILTGTTAETDLSRRFCEHLVDERGYSCAWIGRGDASSPVPQAVAGQETYLDAVLTPGEPLPPDEPARQALDRDEPVLIRADDRSADDTAEEWVTKSTANQDFAGAIAVPIRHDGVRFGVLAAYADEQSHLTDHERTTLIEYAETVGYALTSAERKRSLMASTPITLRVELDSARVPLGSLQEGLPDDASLELLSTVPREDGTTLYVTEIHCPSSTALDAVRDVEGVQSVEDSSDATRCELVGCDPTPEGILASHGVRVDETTVGDDTVTLSLQLPDETPVATVQEVLEGEFGDANVSTIWTGRAETPTSTREALVEMTDRQREVLRHAYDVGYYERPRDTSATELADHFDIARATLTQHLRTAQRKVLGNLFASERPSRE